MVTKCPLCGAVMSEFGCDYCGYRKTKAELKENISINFSKQERKNKQISKILNKSKQVDLFNKKIVLSNKNIGTMYSDKNKKITLLLCLFLGGFGAHHFYAGNFLKGIIYFGTGGIFGIGWILDIILIITGNFKDGKGMLVK